MSKAYLWPLIPLPIVITGPGEYVTRCGEHVTISRATDSPTAYCGGYYSNKTPDAWHRSGRIFANVLSDNDIINKL